MPSITVPLPTLSRRRLLASLLPAASAALLPLLPGSGAASEAGLAAGAEALVRKFADDGVRLLEDKRASAAARAERFRALLEKYFAIDAIARWVLGRYWSQFDERERAQYRRLFEDLVVYGYVKRFGEYTGESLRIVRAQADGETQATVFSLIDRPAGGQPIRVDWRVGGHEGGYRITDVIVENVSLSQTWRSDFASTIQQGGGPSSLLETLGTRTAQLKADLGVGN